MKYIITDLNEIVIGSDTFHSELARSVSGKIVSAGHILLENIGLKQIKIFGRSNGFNIESKQEDKEIIIKRFKNEK